MFRKLINFKNPEIRLQPIDPDVALTEFVEYLDEKSDSEITQEDIYEYFAHLQAFEAKSKNQILLALLSVVTEADKAHYEALYKSYFDLIKKAQTIEELDHCRGKFIEIIDDQIIAKNKLSSNEFKKVSSALCQAQRQINVLCDARSTCLEYTCEIQVSFAKELLKKLMEKAVESAKFTGTIYSYIAQGKEVGEKAINYCALKFEPKVINPEPTYIETKLKEFDEFKKVLKKKEYKAAAGIVIGYLLDALIVKFALSPIKIIYSTFQEELEKKRKGVKAQDLEDAKSFKIPKKEKPASSITNSLFEKAMEKYLPSYLKILYGVYKAENKRQTKEADRIEECKELGEYAAVLLDKTASSASSLTEEAVESSKKCSTSVISNGLIAIPPKVAPAMVEVVESNAEVLDAENPKFKPILKLELLSACALKTMTVEQTEMQAELKRNAAAPAA